MYFNSSKETGVLSIVDGLVDTRVGSCGILFKNMGPYYMYSLGSDCMRLTHRMIYYCCNVCVCCIGHADLYLSYYNMNTFVSLYNEKKAMPIIYPSMCPVKEPPWRGLSIGPGPSWGC